VSGDRVPQDLIDDANRDIVDVIRGYVPDLKKTGKNWSARCPFHKENSASFTVNEDKEMYYCFGCGAGGDAVAFVREMNPGMSFRGAVESIIGEITMESNAVRRAPVIRATRCELPGHAEDREKSAAILSACQPTEQHRYLMQNNTASNVQCLNLEGSLIVPLINNIGEITNVAAINPVSDRLAPVTYAAGNPSFGSTAILEPAFAYHRDGKTIICIDYAHAWRIWWSQSGRSRVLCAMEYDNFNWMLANCKDRFTHIGCDPSEADHHADEGRAVITLPLDPYAKIDRRQCCA
jgi:hypothetical protein